MKHVESSRVHPQVLGRDRVQQVAAGMGPILGLRDMRMVIAKMSDCKLAERNCGHNIFKYFSGQGS